MNGSKNENSAAMAELKLTNTEVTGALLEERVLGSLGSLALGVRGGGGLLSGSGLGLGL